MEPPGRGKRGMWSDLFNPRADGVRKVIRLGNKGEGVLI